MTRYQTAVLTVIAVCLVYLCLVLTPWPHAMAQASDRSQPPAGPSSDPPTRVYIVGWYDADGQLHHLRPLGGPENALPVFRTNP
jgi:hypothetical protein